MTLHYHPGPQDHFVPLLQPGNTTGWSEIPAECHHLQNSTTDFQKSFANREKRLQHNRKANRDKGKPVVLLGVSLGILWDLAKEFSIHEAGHSKLKSAMEVAPIYVRT